MTEEYSKIHVNREQYLCADKNIRYGLWNKETRTNCAIWIYCYSVPVGFEGFFASSCLNSFTVDSFWFQGHDLRLKILSYFYWFLQTIFGRSLCWIVYAHGSTLIGTILKDSLQRISAEPTEQGASLSQNSIKVFELFYNWLLKSIPFSWLFWVLCTVSLCLIRTSCLKTF